MNNVKTKIESNRPGSSTAIATYSLDVSKEDNVASVFKANFGPIDILVNSAAHLSDQATVAESTLANFSDSIEITVKGGFLIAQHFLRNRSENDPFLVSLIAVTTAPASYASSKIAQGKMIEYVASENAGSVRAYSVHPGVIVTEMSTEATRAGHTWELYRSRRH